jgi:hypothetical protein
MAYETDERSDIRIHLALTREEADALLYLLLRVEPGADVSEEMTDRLLCLLADAQRPRASSRPTIFHGCEDAA